MVAVIVLLDQFVWRPVIAWAEKFKVEQVESTDVPSSWLLEVLRESRAVAQITRESISSNAGAVVSAFCPASRYRTRGRGGRDHGRPGRDEFSAVVAVALVLYGSLRAVVTADRTRTARNSGCC